MTVDATIAVVTLAEAKEFLKFSTTSEESILGILINGVGGAIKKILGRSLISASYTEYYDGDGTDELVLSKWPVTALTTLNDDPNRTFASGDDIAAANYLLDGSAGIVRLWNNESHFIKAKGNIKAVYTAGYAVASVPVDIKLAALRWIGREYQRYSDRTHHVVSGTTGDQTTSFDVSAVPADVLDILKRYKSFATPHRFF